MCFYDQYRMSCGDWKWGSFRQHCNREYRTGETCGLKLVMKTIQMEDKCKICQKVETKYGRIRKEQERINRWQKEGNRKASTQAAEDSIKMLENEIQQLLVAKKLKAEGIGLKVEPDVAGNTMILDQQLAEDKNYEAFRLPQVPLTDVFSVFGRATNVEDKKSRSNLADRGATESVGSKVDEADLSGACGTVIREDLSDVSSVRSMDSCFSSLTVSSMSSVGAPPEPGETLDLLLIGDELQILYSQVLDFTSTKDFEGALRYLLTALASGLRREASNKKEKSAAKFLQWRIRNLARRVATLMGIETDNYGSKVSNSVGEIDDGGISDTEMNDSGDDENSNESDIQALERFILQSNAFKDFKASLVGLILPAREAEQDVMERHDGVGLSHDFDGYIGMVNSVEGVLVVDIPWNKEVKISWQCVSNILLRQSAQVDLSTRGTDILIFNSLAGQYLKSKIIEYRQGAAQMLADSIDIRASIDIEREAGSEFCSESGTSESSASSIGSCQLTSKGRYKLGIETKNQNTIEDFTCQEKKEFILLCRDSGNDTRLYHADVSKTPYDYSSYHVLHAQYYGRLKGFWTWLKLREIFSIECVKFSLYWAKNVSIDLTDFGKLPPYPSEDYSFTANTYPPVPRTALRHFIEHPSHAAKQPRHRPKIPKKVGGPLLFDKSLDSLKGYGIYIQERICWEKVFVIEALFATACIIFAVAIYNESTLSLEKWLGGAKEAYEPLSTLSPMKKFAKKLSSIPVVLRVHQDEILNSDDAGIRHVQIAVPDFHRHEDMRFDLWQEFEFFVHEDDPAASVVRGRLVENTYRSDTTFELIDWWLKTCLADHETCGASKKKLPTSVLDVKPTNNTSNLSLYETRGELGNWLALSHCWGAAQMVKTTTQILKLHLSNIQFDGR